MSLQEYLTACFSSWQPPAPVVTARTSCSITLCWEQLHPFNFVRDHLLYRVEVRTRIPAWTVVYSGGKSTKTIENLASSHPQKFVLKVLLKSEAVPYFAEKALDFFGNEEEVYKIMKNIKLEEDNLSILDNAERGKNKLIIDEEKQEVDNVHCGLNDKKFIRNHCKDASKKKWLESQYSTETWTGTDTAGSTAACFCMAVHCGYIKHVFIECCILHKTFYSYRLITMLEERPALIEIINPVNGFTPLATAVRKGDINTVKFLLSSGADVNQTSLTGQAPLHLAVLHGYVHIVELLLDRGAYFQAKDLNSCRVEHYAVDSGSLEMLQQVFSRGGDVTVVDNNLWTPLFRAGSKTEIIEELVIRGSDLSVVDRRGLTISQAAKLLKNRQGRSRDSILRLVDLHFPHEKAFANFTRLAKKISSVSTLLK